jgi:hypothetical protein
MDGNVNPLELNTTFDSYDELKESVAHYQRTNFVQLYKRDARTIRVITKLPNSEQSYKRKVKTHKYIDRQNQSTTRKL